jgi:hypothetical protein
MILLTAPPLHQVYSVGGTITLQRRSAYYKLGNSLMGVRVTDSGIWERRVFSYTRTGGQIRSQLGDVKRTECGGYVYTKTRVGRQK